MNKKLCLFLISICYLNVAKAGAQWVFEQSPSDNNLKAIVFTGNSAGWIIGDNGTILGKSGNEWKRYHSPTKNNLNGIFMNDENEGWAVGDKGTILRYNGKSWENVKSPVNNNLYSVSFNDPEGGIAAGANGVILRYENRIWKSLDRKTFSNLYVIAKTDHATWIGGGLECVSVPILKIENDHPEKITESVQIPATITGLAMIDDQEGWAVGSPGIIMHYKGNRWNKANPDYSFPSLRSVYFSDIENGIGAGYSGTVLIYSGGVWNLEKTTTANNLNGTSISGNSYYIVGDKGLIMKKKMDVDKFIRSELQTETFNITIFPNPADEILNFSIPADTNISTFTASVRSVAGMVILRKEFQGLSGNMQYQINTKSLSNGVYILNVNLGVKSYNSRFIVMHQ